MRYLLITTAIAMMGLFMGLKAVTIGIQPTPTGLYWMVDEDVYELFAPLENQYLQIDCN